jgi:hypothetical protein
MPLPELVEELRKGLSEIKVRLPNHSSFLPFCAALGALQKCGRSICIARLISSSSIAES